MRESTYAREPSEVSAPARQQVRARPVATGGDVSLPSEFDTRGLLKRTAQVVAGLALIGLVVALAPGLGQVRDRLSGADPAWIGVAVLFEALSCVSYVLMFKPIFCARMTW